MSQSNTLHSKTILSVNRNSYLILTTTPYLDDADIDAQYFFASVRVLSLKLGSHHLIGLVHDSLHLGGNISASRSRGPQGS